MPRKVLMIDDDGLLLESTGKYLKLKGWEFDGLSFPEEASSRAGSYRPDLILLDVQLPRRSGWEVCRLLKADPGLRHIPVIMLSGMRMTPEDKAKGIELGADDYLSKPFDLPTLMLKIDAILRVAES